MKFLRDWLRIERPTGIAPNASCRLDLDLAYEDAWRKCIRGIEDVLGGVVRESDRERGTIEATFGLINSERLSCTLQTQGDRTTQILIESRRGIAAEPPKPSQYVRALAEFLQSGDR